MTKTKSPKRHKRRLKPAAVKDMARRRGLQIGKALCGGWYVTLLSLTPETPSPVLYATHDWDKARSFVKKQAILIPIRESDDEQR
jgi:hypothetical protein